MNNTRAPQQGFITIEVIFALIVVAIMTTVGTTMLANQMESQNYQVAAQQQQQISTAAAKYLKDNFATVYANASSTVPAVITPLMLRNTNYLPAGFSDTNAFGQTFVVLARRVSTNQLESIVITSGGETIPEIGTREIAENLGASGGFIPYDNTGVIRGVRGGWQLALSNYGVNPGVGHTASALFLQDGTLANDYLYRNAIPGKAELNRMNTALNMGGNNIDNAADITSTGTITGETVSSTGRTGVGEYIDIKSTVTEGSTCESNGLISKNVAGIILSCQNLIWRISGGKFTITSEYAAGYQQIVRMISSTEGFCYPTLISMGSLNNTDSYSGYVYIGADGYWYVSTAGSEFPRGQSMYARCVKS
ncbi:shufflon system plasmid conjugative transfer pilus tip adhesin PilV [Pseudomonas cichorii]|uniref:shufflon system plasmid conjugative transfer pilus tip adhesin PilV n=1 Tax=Pseudomonas cichorii TaxID=36746 RepID=UPI0018E5DF5E|nr:shufflon system plasmid conjugative transfer pilus tip adhesin PilV [Pseudomonas cichorii]MBI6855922.1 shufflon system plasmid conjugative transfer pilus tip adhesin PilV [Pseudomonas cichorii]